MSSHFTMANLRNFSRPNLQPSPSQNRPHRSPRSPADQSPLVQSQPLLQCLRGGSQLWQDSKGAISEGFPAWKCLPLTKAFPIFSFCLEDHLVCVSLKLTLRLIQFFLPITHPPLLRLICHINSFKLGNFEVSSSVSSASPHLYISFHSFRTQDNPHT